MWSGRVIGMSKGTIDHFEEHLKRCSVFYWIGGPPEMSNYLFYHLGKQMFLLKKYIESGKVLFVGVGRGASIVGASSAAHEEKTMGLLPRVIKSSDDTEQKQGEAMVLHRSVMFLVTVGRQALSVKSLVLRVDEWAAHMPTVGWPVPTEPQRRVAGPSCAGSRHRSQGIALASAWNDPASSASAPRLRPLGVGPSKAYEHSICSFGDHEYHTWKPTDSPSPRAKKYVIYLPSTIETGRDAVPLGTHLFQGTEVVLCPIVYNSKSSTGKWRQEPPKWITEWITHLMEQHGDCKWSLCGFSRGAAWGLQISTEINRFSVVLLVAPYLVPKIRAEKGPIIADHCRLLGARNALVIAYGKHDDWYPDDSVKEHKLIWSILRSCQFTEYENCDHAHSKQKVLKEFWHCLAY